MDGFFYFYLHVYYVSEDRRATRSSAGSVQLVVEGEEGGIKIPP
jgi:hypothetical protein